jgi:UDP-N-acetylglucosamine 2-epimerase (non-hydrolysing)
MMRHKILCVVGTRPEAIKMAPVILALKEHPGIQCRVLATAQHRDLLDQVLRAFEIEPDIDLDIMQHNQALTALTARLLLALDTVLKAEKPDSVRAC